MTRLAVLLFAVFAMSCTANVYPLQWAIGDGFTEEERSLIRIAPDCWNEISFVQQWVHDGESPNQIILVSGDLPGPYPKVSSVHVEHRGRHTIYIRHMQSRYEFFGSLQHEMGHALGLAQMRNGGHIPGPAIMSSPTSSLVVTTNDLAECRRVGVCD